MIVDVVSSIIEALKPKIPFPNIASNSLIQCSRAMETATPIGIKDHDFTADFPTRHSAPMMAMTAGLIP